MVARQRGSSSVPTSTRTDPWVNEIAEITQPAARLVTAPGRVRAPARGACLRGTSKKLDPVAARTRTTRASRPTSRASRTAPSSVPRREEDVPDQPLKVRGDEGDLRRREKGIFRGSMKGRTMYVVPFCMGPVVFPRLRHRRRDHRPAHVAVSMRTMTRMGQAVLDELGTDGFFVKAVHTSAPLLPRARPTFRGRATHQVHLALPETRDLVVSARATAGNAPCSARVLRAAHRLRHGA